MELENLTIRDLQEFREVDSKKLTIGEFKKRLRKLADKYDLNDHQAIMAHRKAMKILPDPSQWV